MRRIAEKILGVTACIAFAACMAPAAFAADASGRSGLEGAAEALRNELAPSMLTYEKFQEELGAEGSVSIQHARVQGLQDVMYNGQPETPTITLKLDNATLRAGEDFDVELTDDNVNPGTVSVVITGKGAYTGTIETSFTILPGDLSYATVDVIPDQEETGGEICPQPTVKLDGQQLTPNVDYTATYRNNIKEGTATIEIEGIGNCTGSTRATFEITEAPEESGHSSSSEAIPAVAIIPMGIAIATLLVIGAFALRRRRASKRNKQ